MLPALARSAQAAPLVFAAAHQQTKLLPTTSAAAALQGHEGYVLGIRAEQAAINDPLLSNALNQLIDHVRGALSPRATDSPAANAAWRAWAKSCGYRHQFGPLESQVSVWLKTAAKHGEAYLRRVFAPVSPDLAPNGLTLHVLRRADIAIGEPGTEGGHEYDAATRTRAVATWFRDTSQTGRAVPMQAVRVEHRDLAILRLRSDADQVAGAPLYTPAFVSAILADRAHKAAMKAFELAASLSMVARTESLNSSWLTGGSAEPDITTADGRQVNRIQPGDVLFAHNVKEIDFPPRQDLKGVQATTDARIAAGAGTTAQAISGNADASFSGLIWAGLMMLMAANRFDKDAGYQHAMDKVLEWFLEAELLAGRHWATAWTWPPRTAPDVMRNNAVQAVVAQLAAGIISLPTARGTLGHDNDKEEDLIAAQPIQENDATRHHTSV